MPEYKIPVRPIKVEYTCDKCGLGRMVYHPEEATVWPNENGGQQRHICSNTDCNQLQFLPRIYPHIRYEHG